MELGKNLGIDKNKFGKIYSFVDFGNVNHWYDKDIKGPEHQILPSNQKLAVDIKKLTEFSKSFSNHNRFYFGIDEQNRKSIHIIAKSRRFFDRTITKPVQQIKHYLDDEGVRTNTQTIKRDKQGNYIYIPKCNFDVEITVDAVKLLDKYNTFCLFSSDSDFSYLFSFLKGKQKKIILIKSGYVQHRLIKLADFVVNAQSIKNHITFIKQKSRF